MAIYQDTRGLMWIGTRNGLNRYDGDNIKVIGKEEGLDNPRILDIEGSHGDSLLWIATRGGVALLDTYLLEFVDHIVVDSIQSSVFEIVAISDEELWYATLDGLYHLDGDGLESFVADSSDMNSLSFNEVFAILPLNDKVYAGTYEGLNILDINSGKIENIENSNDPIFAHTQGVINAIAKRSNGEIWIGVYADDPSGSVVRIQPNGEISKYVNETENPKSLVANFSVLKIMEDTQGRVLIGSNGGGLSIFDEEIDGFVNIDADPKHPNGLNDIDIWEIEEDNKGVLWLGTDGGGVNLYHPTYDRFNVIRNNPFDTRSVNTNLVLTLEEDNKYVWIGTNAKTGLVRFDKQSGQHFNFPFDENKSMSLLDNTVYALLRLNDDLWIGSHSGGLSRLNIAENTFQHYYSNEYDGIPNYLANQVVSIVSHEDKLYLATGMGLSSVDPVNGDRVDYHVKLGQLEHYVSVIAKHNGLLWMGTRDGLEWYDLQSKSFTVLDDFPDIDRSIKQILLVDDVVWLATDDGLVRVQHNQDTLITTVHGLSDNSIQALMADQQNRIWVTTKKGLNLIDPKDNTINVFTTEDGLPSNYYNYGAVHSMDDQAYLGTNQGYVSFRPSSINVDAEVSPPMIDKVDILSESRERTVMLDNSQGLNLDYSESTFAVDFYTTDYIYPSKQKYKYRLVGLNDWYFELGNTSKLTVTDLNYGGYTLEIYATNSEGKWIEQPSTLSITIAPPIWLTWYAWCVYAIALVGLFFARDQYQKAEKRKLEQIISSRTEELRIQKDKATGDKELIAEQASKLQELDKVKTNFFSNISHEFRTPLTLIKAPINTILHGKKSKAINVKETLSIAERNVDVLSKLIDELLEFNKLDLGGLDIHYVPVDIVDYFETLQEGYSVLAIENGVNWLFECKLKDRPIVGLPIDKVSKIVNNLVSNAIKHSPSGGEVRLSLDYVDSQLDISVSDQGQGITPDELSRIFERFYQSAYGRQMPHSSGLGLAYVKEITEALGGEINVDSTPGKGSTFQFIMTTQLINRSVGTETEEPETLDLTEFNKIQLSNNRVLIVEDNTEMAGYIGQILGDQFEIAYAEHGQAGLELLETFKADLIITDLMMPVMDGIEFVTKVKANPDWLFTSLVVLSAKAGFDSKIEALALGLDDYITKPFSPLELEVRITNMLKNQAERRVWKSEIQTGVESDPLINQLSQFIQENISSSSLGVMDLSELVALSERQLTRTIKKHIGLTPSNFIKEVRLNTGREMLEKRAFRTVAEVSRAVGFEKPSYFTKIYLERFGKRPSEYLM